MSNLKGASLLFLLLILVSKIFSQYSYAIHLTTKDGLPSNKVYCTYQDASGFMWFGTDNGLSRYNGSEFKNFSVKDGLPDNDIFSVFEDFDGRIWIIGFKQAPCYFYKNKLFTTANDTFLEKYFKNTDMFQFTVNQQQKRIVFLVYLNESYFFVEYGKVLPMPREKDFTITKGTVYKLFNSNGTDYIISGKWLINLSENKFCQTPNPDNIVDLDQVVFDKKTIGIASTVSKNKLVFFEIVADSMHYLRTIYKDSLLGVYNNASGKTMVLYTDGSIYTINYSTLTLEKVNNKITDSRISTGFIDRTDNKWICTHDNGFFILPKNSAEILPTNNEKGATCLTYNEKDKSVLVGFENNTICLYQSNTYRQFDLRKSRSRARITGLVNTDGEIYIGGDTRLGVFNKESNSYKEFDNIWSPTFNSIKDIELSNTGDILIGSANGASKLFRNNVIDEIWKIRTTAIKESKEGDIYLGTINGLHIRKYGNKQVEFVTTHTGLDNARITDIKMDSKGRVWVGTAQFGLFVIDKNEVLNISDERSKSCYITSYYVKNIFIDEDGNAWISTDNGLNKVNLSYTSKDCSVERITSSYTIPDENINASWFGNDTIYLASLSGVYRLKYSQSNSKETPGIQILNTFVNFKIIDLNASITLKSNENNFSIDYSAIAFKNAKNVEFRYRLLGSDEHWIKSKTSHLDFLSLTPGNYTFEIKSINVITGEESEVKSVSFEILKPWYLKSWFFAIVLLGVIVMVRFIILYRIKRVKEKSEELGKISRQVAELEMQALRAQMNPHFIFNALSAIQNYFVNNNEEKANSYMAKFSKLIRQMLEYSRNNFIPLDEEISLLNNYMELEQMRFENKLEFKLKVSNSIDPTEYSFPSLLLQPILENAVNHGIRPSKVKGIVNLSISIQENHICCIITDNGIGILKSNEYHLNNKTNHNSKGIEILTKRIESMNNLYNCNITFEIIDISKQNANETGTKVILKFPLDLITELIHKV